MMQGRLPVHALRRTTRAGCLFQYRRGTENGFAVPAEKATPTVKRPMRRFLRLIKPIRGSRPRSATSPSLMVKAARSTTAWCSCRAARSARVGGPDTPIPADIAVFDGTGKFVTPGIIDIHSHLGDYPTPSVDAHSDGNEATSPTTPEVWAEHSVWPQDPGFQPRARQWRRHVAASACRVRPT